MAMASIELSIISRKNFLAPESTYRHLNPSINWILGTVQLGMNYGIANEGSKPTLAEAKAIVDLAQSNGLHGFDTAQAYGESEKVLGQVLPKNSKLSLISKLDPGVAWENENQVFEAINHSLLRLGVQRIETMMIHHLEQLKTYGNILLPSLRKAISKGWINKIGISLYHPKEAIELLDHPDIDHLQLPCNPWDQRLLETNLLTLAKKSGVTLHCRSLFLQGLLLMEPSLVQKRLPIAAEHHQHWTNFLRKNNLSPLEFCLGWSHYHNITPVIGVDSHAHLKELIKVHSNLPQNLAPLIEEWNMLRDPHLDPSIILPHLWQH